MDEITRAAFTKLAGIDPPKVDPRTGREERKVRIAVTCRPLQQVLPGGHLVERVTGFGADGEELDPEDTEARHFNILSVYESDLRIIRRDCVESVSDRELEMIELDYERSVDAWRDKNKDATMDECPHSREASFHRVMRRDMRPIVELIELGEEPKNKSSSKAA